MSLKNKLAAVVCGLALVGSIAAPMAAAADTAGQTNMDTGTTTVLVQTDPASTQIKFVVPTSIKFAAGADGTLTGPDEKDLAINNLSVFPIHVVSMQTTAYDGWNIVDDAATASTDNNIQFSVNGVAATSKGSDLSKDPQWNMGFTGAANSSINLSTAGRISKVNKNLDNTKQAATITWKLAAGDAE